MKKIFALITVFFVLSIVLPVAAKKNAAAASANNNATVTSTVVGALKSLPVYKPREIIVQGELTAISSKTASTYLTIKIERIIPSKIKFFPGAYPAKDVVLTVNVLANTKIVRRYGGKSDLSEFNVGDKVWITGRLQADGAVNAKLVKDNTIYKTFYAQKGEVTAIDSAAGTFTLKKNDKEFKVFITSVTKFYKLEVVIAGLADLAVGDEVRVRGVARQNANEITADSVAVVVKKAEVKIKKQKIIEQERTKLEKRKAELEQELAKIKQKLNELSK